MELNGIESKVMDELSEIVISFDGSGKVLAGNRAAREKLDYLEEELEECNMSMLFRQEFQREDGTYIPFDKKKLEDREEVALYRKNSSCFPVTIRFLGGEDGSGSFVAEDISWQKNVDVRIRQMKEEGEANRKLRTEFTANVTHELRTPVNGIKGHVTSLLESMQDEEQKKTLEIILYCCDNMSSIINNILDFSKIEAGKFVIQNAEFDFYKMMERAIATHIATIKKKELHISVYIDQSIPRFMIGDELRINQILNNLLSNAIKFTMVGQISLDVSKTLQVNDEVELFFMVRDTGVGMSKEDQDLVFESYRQADASSTRNFGGTGLGLPITKQLVEMMDGSIHLESEKGKGSCFSFNIKLRTSQNQEESKDVSDAFGKWENLTQGKDTGNEENYFVFGSDENRAEIKKRMEKLVLSIELGSWEKAETLADTIKALASTPDGFMKRPILMLEMAIRKEDYERSMKAIETVKTVLAEKLGE